MVPEESRNVSYDECISIKNDADDLSLEDQLIVSIDPEIGYNFKWMRDLLQSGVNVNKKGSLTTPFCALMKGESVANSNWLSIVITFLNHGGNPFYTNKEENTLESPFDIFHTEWYKNFHKIYKAYDLFDNFAEVIRNTYCKTNEQKYELVKKLVTINENHLDPTTCRLMLIELIDELVREKFLTNDMYNEIFLLATLTCNNFSRAKMILHKFYKYNFAIKELSTENYSMLYDQFAQLKSRYKNIECHYMHMLDWEYISEGWEYEESDGEDERSDEIRNFEYFLTSYNLFIRKQTCKTFILANQEFFDYGINYLVAEYIINYTTDLRVSLRRIVAKP
jgi:hypothetical protein